MEPKRILIAGEFCRSSSGAEYYNTTFALQNGFIRAGHHVLTFSDRDVAREATPFKRKALGRNVMNRALVEAARTYRPHVVLLGHVDMTGADTIEAIAKAAPGVRLAQFNVDAVFRATSMPGFISRAAHLHVSFITTADRDALSSLGLAPGALAFMPNPLDPAIATANVSQLARGDLPYDGIFLGNGDARREAQITELKTNLNDDVRFFAGGRIFGTPRLRGPGFLETLATGAMSPNLPLDETRPVDFLYSSNRIAQLLAQGIVAFCHESARLETIYDDGIINYRSITDLAEQMSELTRDDARRREIARTGWRIGRERTAATRVAQYMLDHIFDHQMSEDYGWPTQRV